MKPVKFTTKSRIKLESHNCTTIWKATAQQQQENCIIIINKDLIVSFTTYLKLSRPRIKKLYVFPDHDYTSVGSQNDLKITDDCSRSTTNQIYIDTEQM